MTVMDFEERRDRVWREKNASMPQRAESARQDAGPVLQAAIAASYVTGTPEWDRLLTIIQAHLESAKVAKAALETALMSPNVIDPQAMMQIKVDALIVSERIHVLEAVIALPSDIMRDAEKARLHLEKLKDE